MVREIRWGVVMLSAVVVACDRPMDPAGAVVREIGATRVTSGAANPTAPDPLGEQTWVCKVGGRGANDFRWEGLDHQNGGATIAGSFALNPGECTRLILLGGLGSTVSVSETPRVGHEIVGIHVDQLTGPDQHLTGTYTASNVKEDGVTPQSALVIFTNRELTGGEGCTPGYWKQPHHLDSWVATGYSPNQLYSSVFAIQSNDNLPAGLTLLAALGLNGGHQYALARHSVAALLGAAHPNVDYAYTTDEVITMTNAAFAANDYGPTKDQLDRANNGGCPLN